ncbi:hypothetical protein B0J14DRAFT_602839 [Halenospora varia]|nr:hypothetical protein B0J14DRAFT_602839 [Halenospora varia]
MVPPTKRNKQPVGSRPPADLVQISSDEDDDIAASSPQKKVKLPLNATTGQKQRVEKSNTSTCARDAPLAGTPDSDIQIISSVNKYSIFMAVKAPFVPKSADPRIGRVAELIRGVPQSVYWTPVINMLPLQSYYKDQIREVVDRADSSSVALCSALDKRAVTVETFRRLVPANGSSAFDGGHFDDDIMAAIWQMLQISVDTINPRRTAHYWLMSTKMWRLVCDLYGPHSTSEEDERRERGTQLQRNMQNLGFSLGDVAGIYTILIPVLYEDQHWILGVIQPTQRRVFVCDPAMPKFSLEGRRAARYMDQFFLPAFNLMAHFFGLGFVPKYTFFATDCWQTPVRQDSGLYVCYITMCMLMNCEGVERRHHEGGLWSDMREYVAALLVQGGFGGEYRGRQLAPRPVIRTPNALLTVEEMARIRNPSTVGLVLHIKPSQALRESPADTLKSASFESLEIQSVRVRKDSVIADEKGTVSEELRKLCLL